MFVCCLCVGVLLHSRPLHRCNLILSRRLHLFLVFFVGFSQIASLTAASCIDIAHFPQIMTLTIHVHTVFYKFSSFDHVTFLFANCPVEPLEFRRFFPDTVHSFCASLKLSESAQRSLCNLALQNGAQVSLSSFTVYLQL